MKAKQKKNPPKTGSEPVAEMSQEELGITFQLLKQNSDLVKNRNASDRIQKLETLKRSILKHRTRLKEALLGDFRKPPFETDATEILPVLMEIHHTRKHLRKWMKKKRVAQPLALFGTASYIYPEARGVVLIVSPWNYPVTLVLRPLISAVAAGNCVVLKPSEHAPNVSRVIREILSEVFPENEVAVVEGSARVSKDLLKLPFDHIYYTGSPSIGKEVMKKAAEHLSSVTLELGGKSPVIVDETADLKKAAKKILMGKFSNAGQTCIAPDYLLVRDTVKEELLVELHRGLKDFYGDLPSIFENEDYTGIIHEKHLKRIVHLIRSSIKGGSQMLTSFSKIHSGGVVAPIVLDQVTDQDPLMKDEIFGPVLPVVAFADLAEAVEIIASRENPLALYIFSRDQDRIDWIIRNTKAGTTAINETLYQYVNPYLPFGGAGFSGIGKGNGKFAFDEFSNLRSVLVRRFETIAIHPPYTKQIQNIIAFLIRRYS